MPLIGTILEKQGRELLNQRSTNHRIQHYPLVEDSRPEGNQSDIKDSLEPLQNHLKQEHNILLGKR